MEPGHGDEYSNNTCAVMGASAGAKSSVGHISQCDPSENTMHDNTYFTPTGKVRRTSSRPRSWAHFSPL
jgi:hypothetical protein